MIAGKNMHDQSQPSQMEALQKSMLLHLQISCWTGLKALSREDMEAVLGVKPSEDLDEIIKLGNKQLVPRDVINRFVSIRRRATERCLRVGTRFMGGFFIPMEGNEETAEALLSDLDEMKAEFNQKLEEFRRTFHATVDEWLENPSVKPYAEVIRKAMPSWEEIEGRYDFRFMPVTINPVASVEEDLAREIGEIPMRAIKEVAQYARAAIRETDERWEGLPSDEVNFTQRAVKRAMAMIMKLEKLSISEDGFTALAHDLKTRLQSLPTRGNLVGRQALDLYKLYMLMADEKAMIGALKAGVIEESVSSRFSRDKDKSDSGGSSTVIGF